MTKKKITILLTIILIISLGVVGGFWWKGENGNNKSIFAKSENTTRLFLVDDNDDVRGDTIANEVVTHINTDDWIVYENKEVGIKFKYPKELLVSLSISKRDNLPRVINIIFQNKHDKNRQQLNDNFQAALQIYKYSEKYNNKKLFRKLDVYRGCCLDTVREECTRVENIKERLIIGKEWKDYESGDTYGNFNGYYVDNEQVYDIGLFMLNYTDRFIWFAILNNLIIEK